MCDWLAAGGNVAAIITALSAGGASLWYFGLRLRRRCVLQAYLVEARRDAESPGGMGAGIKSVMHLMGRCSMTEAQILEAAFGNSKIKTWVTKDPESGRAETLMFQIDDHAWRKLKKSN